MSEKLACRLCEQTFEGRYQFNTHMAARHQGRTVTYYICPHCRWHFLRHCDAIWHEERAHKSIVTIDWRVIGEFSPVDSPPLARCSQCPYRHREERQCEHSRHCENIQWVTPVTWADPKDNTFSCRDIRIAQGLVPDPNLAVHSSDLVAAPPTSAVAAPPASSVAVPTTPVVAAPPTPSVAVPPTSTVTAPPDLTTAAPGAEPEMGDLVDLEFPGTLDLMDTPVPQSSGEGLTPEVLWSEELLSVMGPLQDASTNTEAGCNKDQEVEANSVARLPWCSTNDTLPGYRADTGRMTGSLLPLGNYLILPLEDSSSPFVLAVHGPGGRQAHPTE